MTEPIIIPTGTVYPKKKQIKTCRLWLPQRITFAENKINRETTWLLPPAKMITVKNALTKRQEHLHSVVAALIISYIISFSLKNAANNYQVHK